MKIEQEAKLTALIGLCIDAQVFTRDQFNRSVEMAKIRMAQEKARNPDSQPSLFTLFSGHVGTNGD